MRNACSRKGAKTVGVALICGGWDAGPAMISNKPYGNTPGWQIHVHDQLAKQKAFYS